VFSVKMGFRTGKSCLEGRFDWQVEPTEKWCLDLKKKDLFFRGGFGGPEAPQDDLPDVAPGRSAG